MHRVKKRSQNLLGKLSLLVLWAGSTLAVAQEIPCASDMTVSELPSLYFVVDPQWEHSQRSLFAASNINGWVEGELSQWRLRFNHLAPGLGLAFDILYVKTEVLDPDGNVVNSLSANFPSDQECFLLSIFPGGSTKSFDLSKSLLGLKSRARMRVRVFVPRY